MLPACFKDSKCPQYAYKCEHNHNQDRVSPCDPSSVPESMVKKKCIKRARDCQWFLFPDIDHRIYSRFHCRRQNPLALLCCPKLCKKDLRRKSRNPKKTGQHSFRTATKEWRIGIFSRTLLLQLLFAHFLVVVVSSSTCSRRHPFAFLQLIVNERDISNCRAKKTRLDTFSFPRTIRVDDGLMFGVPIRRRNRVQYPSQPALSLGLKASSSLSESPDGSDYLSSASSLTEETAAIIGDSKLATVASKTTTPTATTMEFSHNFQRHVVRDAVTGQVLRSFAWLDQAVKCYPYAERLPLQPLHPFTAISPTKAKTTTLRTTDAQPIDATDTQESDIVTVVAGAGLEELQAYPIQNSFLFRDASFNSTSSTTLALAQRQRDYLRQNVQQLSTFLETTFSWTPEQVQKILAVIPPLAVWPAATVQERIQFMMAPLPPDDILRQANKSSTIISSRDPDEGVDWPLQFYRYGFGAGMTTRQVSSALELLPDVFLRIDPLVTTPGSQAVSTMKLPLQRGPFRITNHMNVMAYLYERTPPVVFNIARAQLDVLTGTPSIDSAAFGYLHFHERLEWNQYRVLIQAIPTTVALSLEPSWQLSQRSKNSDYIRKQFNLATLWYLQQRLHVSPSDIYSLLKTHTQTASYTISKLKSNMDELQQELQVPSAGLRSMILRMPSLLGMSISGLKSRVDFWTGQVGLSSDDFQTVVINQPPLLQYNLDSNLVPKLKFFQNELQLQDEALQRITLSQPSIWGQSLDRRMRPQAITFTEYFEEMTLAEYGVLVAKLPAIGVCRWDGNLKVKLDFLQAALGLTKGELKEIVCKTPHLLQCSMEKCLKPRLALMGEISSPQEVREALRSNPGLLVQNKKWFQSRMDRLQAMKVAERTDSPKVRNLLNQRSLKSKQNLLIAQDGKKEGPTSHPQSTSRNGRPPRTVKESTINETSAEQKLEVSRFDFWTSQVGLSRDELQTVLLQYKIDSNLVLKLEFFQNELQLQADALRRITLSQPKIWGQSLDRRMRPLATAFTEYFEDMTLAEYGVLLAKQPAISVCRWEGNLKDKLDFLQAELGLTKGELKEVVFKSPNLLRCSIEKCLQPKLELMGQISSPQDVRAALRSNPGLLVQNKKVFQSRMESFLAIKADERSDSPTRMNLFKQRLRKSKKILLIAQDGKQEGLMSHQQSSSRTGEPPETVLLTANNQMKTSTISETNAEQELQEQRVDFWTSQVGLSRDELQTLLLSHPQLLQYKLDSNLVLKLEFFRNELQLQAEGLRRITLLQPLIWGQSLDRRMRPLAAAFTEYFEETTLAEYGVLLAKQPTIGVCRWDGNLKEKLDFLRAELCLTKGELKEVVFKSPNFLLSSMDKCMKPKLELMGEISSPQEVREVILSNPGLLGQSNKVFQSRMDRIRAMKVAEGQDSSTKMNLFNQRVRASRQNLVIAPASKKRKLDVFIDGQQEILHQCSSSRTGRSPRTVSLVAKNQKKKSRKGDDVNFQHDESPQPLPNVVLSSSLDERIDEIPDRNSEQTELKFSDVTAAAKFAGVTEAYMYRVIREGREIEGKRFVIAKDYSSDKSAQVAIEPTLEPNEFRPAASLGKKTIVESVKLKEEKRSRKLGKKVDSVMLRQQKSQQQPSVQVDSVSLRESKDKRNSNHILDYRKLVEEIDNRKSQDILIVQESYSKLKGTPFLGEILKNLIETKAGEDEIPCRKLTIQVAGRAFPPERSIRGVSRSGGMALRLLIPGPASLPSPSSNSTSSAALEFWRLVCTTIWKGRQLRVVNEGDTVLLGYQYLRPSRPRCSLYACREALRVATFWVQQELKQGPPNERMNFEIEIVTDSSYVVNLLSNTTSLWSWGSVDTIEQFQYTGPLLPYQANPDILYPLSKTYYKLVEGRGEMANAKNETPSEVQAREVRRPKDYSLPGAVLQLIAPTERQNKRQKPMRKSPNITVSIRNSAGDKNCLRLADGALLAAKHMFQQSKYMVLF